MIRDNDLLIVVCGIEGFWWVYIIILDGFILLYWMGLYYYIGWVVLLYWMGLY